MTGLHSTVFMVFIHIKQIMRLVIVYMRVVLNLTENLDILNQVSLFNLTMDNSRSWVGLRQALIQLLLILCLGKIVIDLLISNCGHLVLNMEEAQCLKYILPIIVLSHLPKIRMDLALILRIILLLMMESGTISRTYAMQLISNYLLTV